MSFEKHGIKHLSASSINAWIDNPAIWTITYLGRIRTEVGPKAHRGTAVERGFELLLRGAPMEIAVAEAHKMFLELCSGEVLVDVALGIGMLEQAKLWCLEHSPEVAATQLRIETWLGGIPIPFVGYVDFTFMNKKNLLNSAAEINPDVDLKTTERLGLQRSHVRQVALYSHARPHPASLLYVTPKKYQYFVISEEACGAALNELRSAALSLERFLSRVDDAQDALHLLPFDPSHWKVNQQLIDAHAELLGA